MSQQPPTPGTTNMGTVLPEKNAFSASWADAADAVRPNASDTRIPLNRHTAVIWSLQPFGFNCECRNDRQCTAALTEAFHRIGSGPQTRSWRRADDAVMPQC